MNIPRSLPSLSVWLYHSIFFLGSHRKREFNFIYKAFQSNLYHHLPSFLQLSRGSWCSTSCRLTLINWLNFFIHQFFTKYLFYIKYMFYPKWGWEIWSTRNLCSLSSKYHWKNLFQPKGKVKPGLLKIWLDGEERIVGGKESWKLNVRNRKKWRC